MNSLKIRTLIVQFSNEISAQEIPFLRGAIIAASGGENVLFHNHLGDNGFRYSYPLIQYKRINRRAAIVCIGEGTEAIGEFFQNTDFEIMLGKRPVTLTVDTVRANQTLFQLWEGQFRYQMRNWLALNQKNYHEYNKLETEVERIQFLERKLVGNILSFAKSMGVFFEGTVTAKICNLQRCLVHIKGIPMGGFDVEFISNVSLPNFIGFGREVSLGFGTVVRRRERRDNNLN